MQCVKVPHIWCNITQTCTSIYESHTILNGTLHIFWGYHWIVKKTLKWWSSLCKLFCEVPNIKGFKYRNWHLILHKEWRAYYCYSIILYVGNCKCRSRVSSGSIVSDYGLDDRAIGVRSPAGAKDFSSNLCVHRFWGPLSLLYSGYRGSFPRG
jgi:hypothetical protein